MGRRREYSVSGYPSAVDYRKPGRMPCRTCRQRHLGCDEAKPVCGPCKKSNRDCQWPSDEPGRQFRDETENAKRRAIDGWRSRAKSDKDKERGRRESSSRARSRSNSVASSVEPSRSPNPRQSSFQRPSIPETLQSQKELAVYRFFYDNVASPSAGVTDRVHGYLYFLPEMYRNAEPDSHLSFSVAAVALATYLKREPNAPNASAISVEAGQCYGRALELVQIAIKDSQENYKDETLVSSFILSLYELMRSDDPTGWRRHCNGIFALVKHRGAQQFQHPLGVELFRIVLLHTITTCLTWRQKPPQPFEEWAAIFSVAPSTTLEVVRQMYKTVELCAGAVALMHSHSPSHGDLAYADMMKKLQHQERHLRHFEQLLNQQNHFEEFEWPPTFLCPQLDFLRDFPEGFPQRYHVYTDPRRAGWTNILRATRLIINEAILNLCTGASASSTISNIHLPIDPQIDMHNAPENIIQEVQAITNIHSTASSICASLPEQLMLSSSVYADAIESTSVATIEDAFSDTTACPRGFFIVWPLQTVEQTLTRIMARNGDPLNMRFDSGSHSRKPSASAPPAALSLPPTPNLYASTSPPPLYSAPLQSAPLPAVASVSGSQLKRQRVQSSEPPEFHEYQPPVAVHGGTGPDNALVELARMLRWVRNVSSHLGTEGTVVG